MKRWSARTIAEAIGILGVIGSLAEHADDPAPAPRLTSFVSFWPLAAGQISNSRAI